MSIKNIINSFNAEELQQYLTKELEDRALKDVTAYNEFLQFISSFRSRQYSVRNQLLLYIQATEYGMLPIFGTFDEWKQKGTSIKSGEHALTICKPIIGDVYLIKEKTEKEGETEIDYERRLVKWKLTSSQIDELEKRLAERDPSVKKIKALTGFTYVDSIFSLSQTTMKEQDRIEYLQRFNAINTSEENAELYGKLVSIAAALGRNVEEREIKDESLGWVERSGDKIAIKKDMPIDSKCSVLAHEIGHTILHIQNDVANTKSQKEIQAQLFSHLAMLKLGIDAEKQFSLQYINNYIKSETKAVSSQSAAGNELTPGQLMQMDIGVVLPAVNLLVQTIGEKGQPIDADSLQKLQELKIEHPDSTKSKTQEKKSKTETEKINEARDKAHRLSVSTGKPFVAFHWSESNKIKSGDVMSLEKADALLEGLNIKAQSEEGYYKTKLDVFFKLKDGTFQSYEGCRYDIGCEKGGLVQHIEEYVELCKSGEAGYLWHIEDSYFKAVGELIEQGKSLTKANTDKEKKVEIEPLRIYKETDKAVMVKIAGKEVGEKTPAWLPKSKITTNSDGFVIEAMTSTIKEKGLTAKSDLTQNISLSRRK